MVLLSQLCRGINLLYPRKSQSVLVFFSSCANLIKKGRLYYRTYIPQTCTKVVKPLFSISVNININCTAHIAILHVISGKLSSYWVLFYTVSA